MQVIKVSFHHITGIYDVMNYQFTKLLSDREHLNVTCDVIEQQKEICLEPTLNKFLFAAVIFFAFAYDVFVELHKYSF